MFFKRLLVLTGKLLIKPASSKKILIRYVRNKFNRARTMN